MTPPPLILGGRSMLPSAAYSVLAIERGCLCLLPRTPSLLDHPLGGCFVGPSHLPLTAALRSHAVSSLPWAVSIRSAYTVLCDQIHIETRMYPLLLSLECHMATLASRFTTAGWGALLPDRPAAAPSPTRRPPC